jgi:hypothetical protein
MDMTASMSASYLITCPRNVICEVASLILAALINPFESRISKKKFLTAIRCFIRPTVLTKKSSTYTRASFLLLCGISLEMEQAKAGTPANP